jgi:hypothetical protein
MNTYSTIVSEARQYRARNLLFCSREAESSPTKLARNDNLKNAFTQPHHYRNGKIAELHAGSG